MISAIIIDDEQHCIDRLANLLATYCKGTIRLIHASTTVADGVQAILALQPELVFLDVEIGDATGFDLLKSLSKISFEVIFTTAYDKYAVQAFRCSAVDYLLKPIDADELQAALNKLSEKIAGKETAMKLDALFHNLKAINGNAKKIAVPTVSSLLFVQVNEIVRCESNVNYTTIFLKDKQKHTAAKTLKEFEEILSDYSFYRVHNSHLINMAYIKSYHKGKGGTVLMEDGSEIEVSTRRKEDFLKKMTAS